MRVREFSKSFGEFSRVFEFSRVHESLRVLKVFESFQQFLRGFESFSELLSFQEFMRVFTFSLTRAHDLWRWPCFF